MGIRGLANSRHPLTSNELFQSLSKTAFMNRKNVCLRPVSTLLTLLRRYYWRSLILLVALHSGGAGEAAPAWDWVTATPESQGMSAFKIDALRNTMAARKTRALLIIRNDKIVCEWYAPGNSTGTKQGTASLAKALVGGLSLAVALTDGRMGLDDSAAKFISEWKTDPIKSRITIRQLGSHTSGLEDAEIEGLPHEQLTGWKGAFWKRLDPPDDPFTIARDKTPVIFGPGEKLQYSNPGIGMLTYCVTAAIRDSDQKDIRILLRERVMRPIGIAEDEWSCGYGNTFVVAGLPLVASWGGGAYTPRAVARIGRLVLREGDWEGKQILSRRAVLAVTTDAGLPGNCGMGWWGNGGRRYPRLPPDAVWGAGAGDQLLLVIPSLNVVMVRNGEMLQPGPDEPPVRQDDVFTRYHDYRARILFEPLVQAITNREAAIKTAPYPQSPVIQEIRWASREGILRRAKGSDNWPITWGDDDALYTAYGDGNGFEPFVSEKLSMGLATVSGTPPDFLGMNLRAAGLESKGDGSKGRKASGLLMVDGVLYLWARNVTNSQLAWSSDHGKSWTWAHWKFTNSFGCPTFLNFGKNYAQARDDFVYIYSPDTGNAYEAADQMVLARVPRDQIRNRAKYQFFQHIDSNAEPAWTTLIDERAGVFKNRSGCFRSSVSYNAPLKRYLWVQILPGTQGKKEDTRFQGGFGIYDAPEPWGPWTTAFFTEKWDVGPGESGSFPTKWMSNDGRTMQLVFSGEDSFSVREAIAITKE
jgi:CubicO group peptidase (beta-lactamase class C family)